MTKRMAGPTDCVRKSENADAIASSCAALPISATLASSRPNALMTARPEYACSTQPVSLPSDACLEAVAVRVCIAKNLVTSSATEANAVKTSASLTLTENMRMTARRNVRPEFTTCMRPRCSTSLTLSRSFVARLIVSPGWWRSKYASGRRSSLAAICSRSLRFRRSAKLAIMKELTV